MRELLKAALKTGSSSIVTLLCGAVVMKMIALSGGTQEIGFFSLVKQTIQTVVMVGSLGSQTALVQGISFFKDAEQRAYIFWTGGFLLIATLLTTGAFIVRPDYFSYVIFKSQDPGTLALMRWISIPVALGIALVYLSSILNGFQAIGRLAWIQVFGAVAGVLIIYPVAQELHRGSTKYLVIFFSVPPLISLVAASLFIQSKKLVRLHAKDLNAATLKKSLSHFYSLGGSSLITGFLGLGAILVLRIMLLHYQGLADVGIFDVAWTLSMTYVMLILSSFGTYYLPKLTRTSETGDRTILMRNLIKLTLIVMTPVIVFAITFKPFIVRLMYSVDFLPSLKIMRWMLIGDYIKILSFILAMPMLAYVDIKRFILADVFGYSFFLLCSSISIIVFHSTQYIGLAFVGLYALLIAYNLYYLHRTKLCAIRDLQLQSIFLGLALIIAASIFNWQKTQVDYPTSAFWIALSLIFSGLHFNKSDRISIMKLIQSKGAR